jgi:hypothetical protein
MLDPRQLAIVLECLFQLEGYHAELGWLSIKDDAIEDVNAPRREEGRREWTRADCHDKARATVIAMEYIMHYEQPGWEPNDAYLCFRAGPTGMRRLLDREIADDLARFGNLYRKLMEDAE